MPQSSDRRTELIVNKFRQRFDRLVIKPCIGGGTQLLDTAFSAR
jgi:hypothetical protein